jgi:hypothetical protein
MKAAENKGDAQLMKVRRAADYLGLSVWTVRRLGEPTSRPSTARSRSLNSTRLC